jgi:steroid delta-isomerase-like uncharacterized protein
MSTQENKAIIRRYVDELNRRNLAIIDELVADKVVLGSLFRTPDASPVEEVTREAYKEDIRHRVTASPDYYVTIEEMIAEDDQVVLHWTRRWTHRETFLGVPPTGKEIRETAISIYRIAAGKIVEVRGFWNRADTWQQLGLIPETREILPPDKA